VRERDEVVWHGLATALDGLFGVVKVYEIIVGGVVRRSANDDGALTALR